MDKLKEIRDASFALAKEGYIPTTNPEYKKYSSIYLAPTSNVKGTMKLYKDAESVLSVGATGALGFEALLNGAKKVDLFDINELQRLFFLYMQTAIKYLSYKDFIKHFTLQKQPNVITKKELSNLISESLYEKIVDFLPSEVEKVYTPLYDFFDSATLILSSLYRYEHIITLNHLKKICIFL